jgi:hypothetical protein
MYAQMRTGLLLSVAVHVAVLGWAAFDARRRVPERAARPGDEVVAVDLASWRAERPATAALAPPRELPAAADTASAARRAVAGATEPGRPTRTLRTEAFARLTRITEITANAAQYCRTAPREFEKMIRAAGPPGGFPGAAKATVLIPVGPSGAVGPAQIQAEPGVLGSALGAVRWEGSPLPTARRIPCSGVRVRVAVVGRGLRVAVEIL